MRTTALSPATVSTMPCSLIISISRILFVDHRNTIEGKEQGCRVARILVTEKNPK
jgi:hypothetical protein